MHKSVVITGTNRGIGRALAEEYLRKSATVFGLNRHVSEEESRLVEKYANEYFSIECDVVHESQIHKAVKRVSEITGSIDILINNAAIHLEQPFSEENEINADLIKKTFETNSVGPLLVVKHFLALVTVNPGSMIVNISSEAGSIATCWRTREYGYCMSKAALNMATAILQNKVKDLGVKVLSLHPGWVRTDMGGTEAPLDPTVVAATIVNTIAENNSLELPSYIDYNGKQMEW